MAVRPAPVPGRARVVRFGATERHLHTIHGSAFVVMTLTGLVLYQPILAQLVSSRPLMKAIHLGAASGWLTALAIVALLGDRSALRRTRRELERFDADDVRWLRRIVVTDRVDDGYWQQRGYDRDAWIGGSKGR